MGRRQGGQRGRSGRLRNQEPDRLGSWKSVARAEQTAGQARQAAAVFLAETPGRDLHHRRPAGFIRWPGADDQEAGNLH